jgi:CheY-like chemotaxis protein
MVTDGLEAVAAAAEHRFDLIMLDMQMPNMDGLAAAKLIRNQPGPNSTTPILAITAYAMDEHRTEWAAIGVEGFITKPLNADLLLTTVVAVATRRPPPREAAMKLGT